MCPKTGFLLGKEVIHSSSAAKRRPRGRRSFSGPDDDRRVALQIQLFARQQLDERCVVQGSSTVRHTPKKKERSTSPRRKASCVRADTLPDLASIATLVADLYRSKVIAR